MINYYYATIANERQVYKETEVTELFEMAIAKQQAAAIFFFSFDHL